MSSSKCEQNVCASVLRRATEVLLLVVAVLAISVPLFSQGAVGTILGGVYDTSGGAIAGAKVTITDVARGTTHEITTDESGQFTVPSLLVGTYSVRAESQGFQTVDRTNVLLEVSASVRVDLKLPPGQQSQTVTVNEVAPAINTTDATLGGTVTNSAVVSLPLEGRNFLQLLQLRPGVVDTPGGNGNATASNGRRQGADVLLIEGVTQFDLGTSNVLINGAQKGGAVDALPLDSIQEFATQQNAPAEYGWRDGSAVNVAVKSGTNSFHGSAYAFGRDAAATDAKQFSAVPNAVQTVGNATVEQPGFTFGGPLMKDKLFFFVSGEFIRQSSFDTASYNVPADLGTAGVTNTASNMVDACKVQAGTVAGVNPLSAQIAGITNFNNPGNTATFCVPQQATSSIENLFPYNPSTSIQITPHAVTTVPSNNGLVKVDYSPNNRHHFDAFYYISRETTSAGNQYQPYWSTLGVGSTEEYAGAWTWTPNSRWVNDLRGGAAPNSGNSVAADVGVNPATAYSGPGTYGINTGSNGFGFMCVQIASVFPTNGGIGDCGKNGIRGPQYQLDFTDKVSYLRGNHAFKWGVEQVFVKFDDSSTASQQGIVNFLTLQAFLAGSPNSGSIITGDNTDHWREQWHAAFFQDTWRVTPRLTLTPGIRWEYIGAPHSTTNKMGNFDPNQPGGAIQVGPGLPNSSCVTNNVSCESTVTHSQKTDFNPRFGAAWDMFGNGKAVLRFGVGMMSSFPTINSVAGNQIPYGATLCSVTPCDAAHPNNIVINRWGTTNNAITPNTFSPTPIWTNNTTAVFNQSAVINATSGPTCGPGGSVTQCSMLVTDPNLKNPRSVQWSLDLQRAITNSITLDVAYVGVHGWNEIHTVDLNEPTVGSGWDASALFPSAGPPAPANACLGPNPAAPNVPTQFSGITKCKSDAAAENLARPYHLAYPYFQYIAQTTNGFISNYDGLQMTLDSRNYHGLSFLGSYTFAHALDDWTKSSQATAALADPTRPQYVYGTSDYDVRHRFRFSPTYQIPGIKSPGQMLEGWQLSAIWSWQTGLAYGPDDATANDWGGTGENSDRTIPNPNSGVWQSWNYSGPRSAFSNTGDTPIPCYGGASGCTSWTNAPVSVWNTCSAAAQAPYGNGTMNVGGTNVPLKTLALAALTSATGACYIQKGGVLTPPAYGTLGNGGRGMFHGPDFQDVDLNLAKTWHFKERYSAQMRIEVYNLFNHVNFAQVSNGAGGSPGAPNVDPSTGGGSFNGGNFGFSTAGQQLSGISSNRQFQFGLKLMF
jgi:hypothetical protein